MSCQHDVSEGLGYRVSIVGKNDKFYSLYFLFSGFHYWTQHWGDGGTAFILRVGVIIIAGRRLWFWSNIASSKL